MNVKGPNDYRLLPDGTAEILLTKGKVCRVDAADLPMLLLRRWTLAETHGGHDYAVAKAGNDQLSPPFIRMHRLLCHGGPEVDHRNGDGLDNRRSNLRPATHRANLGNQRKRPGKNPYKGMYWSIQAGKWAAYIGSGPERRHLGLFTNPEEAARAYDAAARERFGEFARCNFEPVAAEDVAR